MIARSFVARLFKASAAVLSVALLVPLAACGQSSAADETVVQVAARADFDEIWAAVNKELEPEHIKVVNKAYDTSVNLSDLVLDGDIDMNTAQHPAVLENYQKENPARYSDLAIIGTLHLNPMFLYSKKYKSVDQLPDNAKIAIPDDAANEGHALSVLERAGLIKLREDAPILPSVDDIAENPKHIQFENISSEMMVRVLDDVDAGIVYNRNATDAGLNPKTDPIYRYELTDLNEYPIEKKFVISFIVKKDRADDPVLKKVVEAYHSDAVIEAYRQSYPDLLPVNGDIVTNL
ncbi:MetQ/NlpA family ABC transporter substrate-binding protein [Bifidobacterium vespertilionis]|uniref:MetQ/NlpA family ABC transporter substrate-binding protein n=1 Tax=Bifidobacterium vespertilionis TaxID=2562524 RepID=UPI001BDCD08F|nr:MetQ/NlpA family ABC transporter substrate-binding protein [Bifidobacterium vespertilionis]MBT1179807.1 hypothetical protein [Bifidobacterium vespertilionis]